MIENIDLTKRLTKTEYKSRVRELTPVLRDLQIKHWQAKIPTVVVLEGWDCAGKGECISLLAEILDPRGFKVHPTFEPSIEEALRPFLWRFWVNTPAQGEIVIFDRSWYQRVLTDRVDDNVKKRKWKRAYEQICDFERQLADGGTRILKFFLHITKGEQKKRFKKYEADPVEAWRVRKEDWEHHRRYDEFIEAAEEMFFRTDAHHSTWRILPAECARWARVAMIERLIEDMQEALEQAKAKRGEKASQDKPVPPKRKSSARRSPTILDKVDLSQSVEKKEYEKELLPLQTRLRELNFKMFKERVPAVVVYEGWDAGGKGGNIKRLVARLDPRGYDVTSISKPTGAEVTHHYLWRFWKQLPKDGHMSIFDRSWYGRVLVERVEGFCTEDEWHRSYQEINEFEGDLASHGTVLVKFWIHISREEQAARFKAREVTPHKQWKITEEDWRNRDKWDLYEPAVVEMLQRTSTPHSPWTIIAGNCKRHARLTALRTVIERLEAVLD